MTKKRSNVGSEQCREVVRLFRNTAGEGGVSEGRDKGR